MAYVGKTYLKDLLMSRSSSSPLKKCPDGPEGDACRAKLTSRDEWKPPSSMNLPRTVAVSDTVDSAKIPTSFPSSSSKKSFGNFDINKLTKY